MYSVKIDLGFGDGEGTILESESEQPMAIVAVIIAAARRLIGHVLGYEPEVEFKILEKDLTPKDLVK